MNWNRIIQNIKENSENLKLSVERAEIMEEAVKDQGGAYNARVAAFDARLKNVVTATMFNDETVRDAFRKIVSHIAADEELISSLPLGMTTRTFRTLIAGQMCQHLFNHTESLL